MYGLVIYTKPVACISDMVYGRMYHLENTEEIMFQAILNYQRLIGTTDLQWRPVIPTIEKNGPLLEGKS